MMASVSQAIGMKASLVAIFEKGGNLSERIERASSKQSKASGPSGHMGFSPHRRRAFINLTLSQAAKDL